MTADWRSAGACANEDPDLFFPDKSRGPLGTQVAVAKAVCARCDVVTTCLLWAVATNQMQGVWGGTDETERRQLRRIRPDLKVA